MRSALILSICFVLTSALAGCGALRSRPLTALERCRAETGPRAAVVPTVTGPQVVSIPGRGAALCQHLAGLERDLADARARVRELEQVRSTTSRPATDALASARPDPRPAVPPSNPFVEPPPSPF